MAHWIKAVKKIADFNRLLDGCNIYNPKFNSSYKLLEGLWNPSGYWQRTWKQVKKDTLTRLDAIATLLPKEDVIMRKSDVSEYISIYIADPFLGINPYYLKDDAEIEGDLEVTLEIAKLKSTLNTCRQKVEEANDGIPRLLTRSRSLDKDPIYPPDLPGWYYLPDGTPTRIHYQRELKYLADKTSVLHDMDNSHNLIRETLSISACYLMEKAMNGTNDLKSKALLTLKQGAKEGWHGFVKYQDKSRKGQNEEISHA